MLLSTVPDQPEPENVVTANGKNAQLRKKHKYWLDRYKQNCLQQRFNKTVFLPKE